MTEALEEARDTLRRIKATYPALKRREKIARFKYFSLVQKYNELIIHCQYLENKLGLK